MACLEMNNIYTSTKKFIFHNRYVTGYFCLGVVYGALAIIYFFLRNHLTTFQENALNWISYITFCFAMAFIALYVKSEFRADYSKKYLISIALIGIVGFVFYTLFIFCIFYIIEYIKYIFYTLIGTILLCKI
jgi:hypothetical protein